MSLLPWSRAESAVETFEKTPSLESIAAARDAIEALSRQQFLPGVKTRLEQYKERLQTARPVFFDALIRAGNVDAAKRLTEDFPQASKEKTDGERMKLAYLAHKLGKPFPSVADISVSTLSAELRPAYFELRYRETADSQDEAPAREILGAWMGHDRTAFKPRQEFLRRLLAREEYEAARKLLESLSSEHQTRAVSYLVGEKSLPVHGRSYFLIQIGAVAAAGPLVDTILKENPEDEWALAERARMADSSGDTSSARLYYARLLDRTPHRIDVTKRLAELAYAERDMADASKRFGDAWAAGDLESGVYYAQLLAPENPQAAADVALKIAGQTKDAGILMTMADILLGAGRVEETAGAFRAAMAADYNQSDAIISKAHAYVEKHPGSRMPLLRLLVDIVPLRGFEVDVYKFMEAEDWMAEGRKAEARSALESLLATESRWKAYVELSKIAMTEGRMEQEILAKRLESVLPESERGGRGVPAELAYNAALLWEASGNREKAAARLEKLIEREYQYRDAAVRLAKLQRPETPPAAVRAPEVGAEDKTMILTKAEESAARYELMERIGEGGMGAVHKARDRKLDRLVAVKLLSLQGDTASDLIVREARTTAKLSHPNIVSVFDVGKESGRWFIAMEYVEGPTLKEVLKKGPMALDGAAVVIFALLDALEAAHQHSVVHRDMKPANVLIKNGVIKRENIKLTDFGLARVSTEASIVMRGAAAGTAAYMSPEQVKGEKVDGRTDIYACGCLLYEMLSGEPLFHGTDVWTTMYQHLNEEPARLMKNQILSDAPLTCLLLGFLTRDPAMRYASASDAARATREAVGARL